jgi:hypothetical protein
VASDRRDKIDERDFVIMTGRRAGKSMLAKMLKPRPEIRGTEASFVIMDECTDSLAFTNEDFRKLYLTDPMSKDDTLTEVQQELDKLCERMTAYFAAAPDIDITTTLSGPGNLTVSVPGKGYRKRNHVGGEEFVAKSARRGASDKIIFVFKPASASEYTEMEMTEVDAAAQLNGGRALLNAAAGGDFFAELRNIRAIGQKQKQALEVVAKQATYPDFGSW